MTKQPTLAGKIIDIDGPRLYFTRKFSTGVKGVFQAITGTYVFLNDILQTDRDTRAVIEFCVGGRVTVDRNERILVRTPESIVWITPKNNSDLYMSDLEKYDSPGALLGRRNMFPDPARGLDLKRREKEFHIKTTGGVLGGIEG